MRRPAIIAVVIFLGALTLLRFLFPYISPFVIAFLAASVLDLPISYLERVGLKRSVASFLLVVTTFAGLPVVLGLFLMALLQEIDQLKYSAILLETSSTVIEKIQTIMGEFPFPLSEITPLIMHRVSTGLITLGEILIHWITSIPDFIVIWLVASITAYFLCRDKRVIAKFAAAQMPKPWKEWLFQIRRDTMSGMLHLIQIQIIIMTVSTLLTIGFFSVLELPYAVVLGLLTGFADFLPLIGPAIVYVPVIIFQFWSGRIDLGMASIIAYLILILVRQIWEPRLVSAQLGVHPISTIIGLYLGIRILGAPGIILGPLLLVFCQTLFRTTMPNKFSS